MANYSGKKVCNNLITLHLSYKLFPANGNQRLSSLAYYRSRIPLPLQLHLQSEYTLNYYFAIH